MSICKARLTGLALAMSVCVSVAGGSEINSAYEATGIAHQPTGKFVDAVVGSGRLTIQGYDVTPQAASTPTALLIESTLSRQLYKTATACVNFTGIKWPLYQPYIEGTITPQNLSSTSDPNVVEVQFNTQVTIVQTALPTVAPPTTSADGVSLTCVICQPADCTSSVPCPNTADGPFMLRQGQDTTQKSRQVMTSYVGYAKIDHTEPVKVIIGLSTLKGTQGNACFGTLVLRTR